MFKRGLLVLGAMAVVLAALTLSPSTALAARRGGGGWHGGGWHGGGFAGRGYVGRGWGGYGWGNRYGWYGGRGWGWGLYGLGLGLGYGLGWPYGYGYSPYWDGYGGYYGYYPYSDSYSSYPYAYSETSYPELYPEQGYYGSYPTTSYAQDYYGATGAAPAAPAVDNSVNLRVIVPPDARVWFNGQPTTEQGRVRVFESPPLTPGRDYTYDIRAEWQDNGRPVTQTRHVDVQAGDSLTVDFMRPPA